MIAKWFQVDGTMKMISDRGAPGEFLHATITRTKPGKDAQFILRSYAIERGVHVGRKFPPDTFNICFIRALAHGPSSPAAIEASANYYGNGSKEGIAREVRQRRLVNRSAAT